MRPTDLTPTEQLLYSRFYKNSQIVTNVSQTSFQIQNVTPNLMHRYYSVLTTTVSFFTTVSPSCFLVARPRVSIFRSDNMSRLIVKGLPKRYGDDELRKLFSQYGDVTDARVVKTPQGQSRCFGFVGFRLKQHASRAHSAMKRVYIDTCPVKVDFALALGDPALPRPWSRYSKGSSQYDRQHPRADNSDKHSPTKSRGKRSRAPDSDTGPKTSDRKDVKRSDDKVEKVNDDFAAFEEVLAPASRRVQTVSGVRAKEKTQFVTSRKNGEKGSVVERKHVTFDSDDSEVDDDHAYQDLPNETTIRIENEDTDPAKAGNVTALDSAVSDMDYFKSKIASSTSMEPIDEPQSDSAHPQSAPRKETVAVPANTTVDGYESSEDTDEERDRGKDSNGSGVSNVIKKSSNDTGNDVAKENGKNRFGTDTEDQPNPGETGRLMVRNLAFSLNEDELEKTFESFGDVAEVHIVRNASDGKSRGMGFIQYAVPENAARALVALDGSFLSGRILHVLPARPKLHQSGANVNGNPKYVERENPGSSTFKTSRADEQKKAAESGNDNEAQYAMHMSKDAIADVAAARHGVSKAELYGASRGESGIAAVRLAIAEASIQGETRAFLVQNGLNVDIVERMAKDNLTEPESGQRKRRSRTAFLVKDLPAGTTESELQRLFQSYGKLKKLLVVPSGLLGVVQFTTASSAKVAYNNCAYSKFKGSVIFLQWLPDEVFEVKQRESSSDADNETKLKASSPSITPQNKQVLKTLEGSKNEDDDDFDGGNGASVYVKNLSFETRDDGLRSHFETVLRRRPELVSSLRSAKVALKRGPEGKESSQLSMGFGFLEFRNHEDAKGAVKIGQNSSLDGHELKLQISHNKDDRKRGDSNKRKRSSSKGKAGPKLIVRNVAFEATRKDIRQLFASFGQLKTVRMPSKMDGSHRGFGFVEFVSKNEAIAAMDALSAAHLYGRHLVIEFADETQDSARSVAELQERAAVQFASKRRRVDGVDSDHKQRPVAHEEKDDDAMMHDELYA